MAREIKGYTRANANSNFVVMYKKKYVGTYKKEEDAREVGLLVRANLPHDHIKAMTKGEETRRMIQCKLRDDDYIANSATELAHYVRKTYYPEKSLQNIQSRISKCIKDPLYKMYGSFIDILVPSTYVELWNRSLNYLKLEQYEFIEIELEPTEEIAERLTTNKFGKYNVAYIDRKEVEKLQEDLLLNHSIQTFFDDSEMVLVNLNRTEKSIN